jgi:hypothetical protein
MMLIVLASEVGEAPHRSGSPPGIDFSSEVGPQLPNARVAGSYAYQRASPLLLTKGYDRVRHEPWLGSLWRFLGRTQTGNGGWIVFQDVGCAFGSSSCTRSRADDLANGAPTRAVPAARRLFARRSPGSPSYLPRK